jgi:hypothetical protein
METSILNYVTLTQPQLQSLQQIKNQLEYFRTFYIRYCNINGKKYIKEYLVLLIDFDLFLEELNYTCSRCEEKILFSFIKSFYLLINRYAAMSSTKETLFSESLNSHFTVLVDIYMHFFIPSDYANLER